MTVFGLCEKGNVRSENQDSILIREKDDSGLFIVADGVGGLSKGAEVSRFVTEEYGNWWEWTFLSHREDGFVYLFDSIKETVRGINSAICNRNGIGSSGSTIALLFIHQGSLGWLTAGDSRIYRCNRDGARLMTRDDTWGNRPGGNAGETSAEMIISAVGASWDLEYSCATDKAERGESFMLCSDGIYKFLPHSLICSKLKMIHMGLPLSMGTVSGIVRRALENGSSDNCSIIMVKTKR